MKNIIITLITLITFSFSQDCEEPIDVWFKISNDNKSFGKLMTLDMSAGYAGTDGAYVYLFVNDLKSKEGIVIAFPIGYWEAGTSGSKFEDELEKEFKDLEDYLKHNKGKGIKIEKRY